MTIIRGSRDTFTNFERSGNRPLLMVTRKKWSKSLLKEKSVQMKTLNQIITNQFNGENYDSNCDKNFNEDTEPSNHLIHPSI